MHVNGMSKLSLFLSGWADNCLISDAYQAIFGFAILKPLSKMIPESGILGRFLGGQFGPKENCTVQTYVCSSVFSIDEGLTRVLF